MKKTTWFVLLLAAVAAAALRAGQMRTGFDADGLAVAGNPFALLLIAVLALSAAYFVFSARALRAKRGEGGGLAEVFRFAGKPAAAVCGVAGSLALLVGAAASALANGRVTLLTPLAVASALCLLYAVFALYRGAAVQGVALLVPVCALAVYLILLYRADAFDPVLARTCVELLAVAALTFSALERAAFAFRDGSPRVFLPACATSVVLALCAAAEGGGFARLALFLGGALVEAGFLLAAEPGDDA